MPNKYLFYIPVIFILSVACSDFKSTDKIVIGQYEIPNIDSLIAAQMDALNTHKVAKTVKLNGEIESTNIVSDTTFWKSELSVFSELEINKPSLIGAYNTEMDEGSKISFIRKEAENRGANNVQITKSARGALLNLSGTVKAINHLYSSEQVLNLNFNENTGLIENYTFSGFQKLIGNDTVFFKIKGVVK